MSKPSVVQTVQEFMLQVQRPYGINEILEKCGKDLGKAAVQKSLDLLVDKNRLKQKTYGKHKIYYAQQADYSIDMKREQQQMKQKVLQSQNLLRTTQDRLREMEVKLKSVAKVKSLTTLEEERDQLMEDIRVTNEKLRAYQAQESENKLTGEDVKAIENKYENFTTAYRKRKRICNDMLDAIMEGYPKKKKDLINDIGLETDEEVNFKLEIIKK